MNIKVCDEYGSIDYGPLETFNCESGCGQFLLFFHSGFCQIGAGEVLAEGEMLYSSIGRILIFPGSAFHI